MFTSKTIDHTPVSVLSGDFPLSCCKQSHELLTALSLYVALSVYFKMAALPEEGFIASITSYFTGAFNHHCANIIGMSELCSSSHHTLEALELSERSPLIVDWLLMTI